MTRQGAEYNGFCIEQNATFEKTIRIKDSSGTLVPLTNIEIEMDIRETPESSTEILTLTEGNGRIINDNSGEFKLLISKDDTGNLDFSAAFYDIRFLNTVSGVADFNIYGLIEYKKTVTR